MCANNQNTRASSVVQLVRGHLVCQLIYWERASHRYLEDIKYYILFFREVSHVLYVFYPLSCHSITGSTLLIAGAHGNEMLIQLLLQRSLGVNKPLIGK